MQKLNRTLLFINLFAIQAYLIRFEIFTYPTNLQEILISLNCLTFLSTHKGLPNLKKYWIIWSLIILSGLSIATTDIINQLDLFRHLKFLAFGSALTYIFCETLNNKNEQEKGIQIAIYGALTFGIFSALYNLFGFNAAYDHRLLGPLDAAVYLAFYLAPFFIYSTISAFEQKNRSQIIISTILGALLIATLSMGAIAGSFICISLYLLNRANKKTKIILSTIATIIFVSIFYTKILPTIQTEYSSLDERGQIWQTSAYLLEKQKNLITGVGLGQFQENYAQSVKSVLGKEPLDYFVLQPHNIFLLFIFNYGILGLSLLLTLIVLNIKSKSIYKYIAFYFLIHGLIDTPIFKNDILFLFILFNTLSLNPKLNLSKQLPDQKI